jgi:glycosyltransferase involved in cell wall biosynthesis
MSHHRYVVTFAGARDHYQVALALAETDELEQLVNEFYWPKVPQVLQGLVARLNPKTRDRVCPGLPAARVTLPVVATIAWLLGQVWKSDHLRTAKDAALGRAAGSLARRTGAGLLAYSYYASYAFERAPRSRKIIFQVHPHPQMTREILQEELRLQPKARVSLLAEPDLNFAPAVIARLSREAGEADFVLTPSTFAKKSLMAAGVAANRIAVVPYGIDGAVFQPKTFGAGTGGRALRLIFVGSLVQRKGLSYLLEAMRRLQGEPVELVLVGRGARDEQLLREAAEVRCRVAWNAPRRELVGELQAADVFVFPSLVESFAHVILEAMAIGLPVITTTNTAGPDLLEEGRTGFIGSIRDVDFMVEKIRWFLAHREAIPAMGRACQEAAAQRTWARFRQELRSALGNFPQIPEARSARTA